MTARFHPRRSLGLVSLLALVILVDSRAAQAPAEAKKVETPRQAIGNEPGVLLEVRGEVARPLSLSQEDFARLPRRTVQAKAHDGVESRFEGVPLNEILAKAGVPTGNELRGKELTLYVVVEAADGYRALYALPELDPAYTDRIILLADRRDDKPLPERTGPLQVIVPGEKKHARWVRQVIRIKVGRAQTTESR
jgi:DMSO/TMAO reductase YedYZ molybdopterin-dependent catalytic subunit